LLGERLETGFFVFVPNVVGFEYVGRTFRITTVYLNAISLFFVETGYPGTDGK
jgi:hypothetical protein